MARWGRDRLGVSDTVIGQGVLRLLIWKRAVQSALYVAATLRMAVWRRRCSDPSITSCAELTYYQRGS
jgi:hypothetical protein